MTTTTKTPNQIACEARGTAAPFTLAQTTVWVEGRARLAREAAGRWVEGSRRHRTHAREAERFEAIARELYRLRDIADACTSTDGSPRVNVARVS